MTISTKQIKGGTGLNAAAEGRDPSAKPKFSLFRMLYQWFKYGTIIGVVLAIVLGGVMILGEVGEEIQQEKSIEALFKSSPKISETVEGIEKLFNSKKASFISNRAINLYLEQKPSKNDDQNELDHRFSDMGHFVNYFLTQRYEDETVIKLPLDLYGKNYLQVVQQPVTSKAQRWLKIKVETFLKKNSLEKSDSTKQLKWSRVKKLIDGGKFDELLEIFQENVVNWVWQWIGKPAKVIVLLVDDSKMSKSNYETIQKNKKLLKKWVQQYEDDHEIIIVSKYSINTVYDQDKEQSFKSFRVDAGLQKFENGAICKFLNEYQTLNEKQCEFLRGRFDTLDGLYNFVDNYDEAENKNSWATDFSDKQKEVNKVLQKVCDKGQVKYYFYEDQEDVNKVLTISKKAKKSRMDRELDALLVKFSEMKHFMGLNRVKDVYNTFFNSKDSEKLTVREANSIGLLYDFEEHTLKWRSDEERLAYEVRVERSCGEQQDNVKVDEKNDEEDKKNQNQKKEEEQKQEQEQAVDQEEEQETVQEEEYLQEEYEQNPIHYNDDDEEQTTNETEENQLPVGDEQVEDEDEETEETTQEQVEEEQTVEEAEEQGEAEEDKQTAEEVDDEAIQSPQAQDEQQQEQVNSQQSAEEDQEQANTEEQEQANTQNQQQQGQAQTEEETVEQQNAEQQAQNTKLSESQEQQQQAEKTEQQTVTESQEQQSQPQASPEDQNTEKDTENSQAEETKTQQPIEQTEVSQ